MKKINLLGPLFVSQCMFFLFSQSVCFFLPPWHSVLVSGHCLSCCPHTAETFILHLLVCQPQWLLLSFGSYKWGEWQTHSAFHLLSFFCWVLFVYHVYIVMAHGIYFCSVTLVHTFVLVLFYIKYIRCSPLCFFFFFACGFPNCLLVGWNFSFTSFLKKDSF